MQQSWFDRPELEPLASRLRPQTLEEIVGQSHLLGPRLRPAADDPAR